ncbi:MAG: tripartite tricarboxylate transporter TctB family protein [Roseovarius sp.]
MTRGPEKTAEDAPGTARWNLWLGIGTLVFVAVCLLVWFPVDIGSGFLEQNLTGRTVPGDSFFPILLVGLMVPLALLLIASDIGTSKAGGETVGKIAPRNLLFIARIAALIAACLLVTGWTGPLLVWLTNTAGLTDHSGYRAVSATFPYDVSGFFVGATLLTCGLIHTARHKLGWRDVVIGAATAIVLIVIFDGLLNNIQLPPNADL